MSLMGLLTKEPFQKVTKVSSRKGFLFIIYLPCELKFSLRIAKLLTNAIRINESSFHNDLVFTKKIEHWTRFVYFRERIRYLIDKFVIACVCVCKITSLNIAYKVFKVQWIRVIHHERRWITEPVDEATAFTVRSPLVDRESLQRERERENKKKEK